MLLIVFSLLTCLSAQALNKRTSIPVDKLSTGMCTDVSITKESEESGSLLVPVRMEFSFICRTPCIVRIMKQVTETLSEKDGKLSALFESEHEDVFPAKKGSHKFSKLISLRNIVTEASSSSSASQDGEQEPLESPAGEVVIEMSQLGIKDQDGPSTSQQDTVLPESSSLGLEKQTNTFPLIISIEEISSSQVHDNYVVSSAVHHVNQISTSLFYFESLGLSPTKKRTFSPSRRASIQDGKYQTMRPIIKNEICLICLDKESDTFFTPCLHHAMCLNCLQNSLERNMKNCPMCRDPFTASFQIRRKDRQPIDKLAIEEN